MSVCVIRNGSVGGILQLDSTTTRGHPFELSYDVSRRTSMTSTVSPSSPPLKTNFSDTSEVLSNVEERLLEQRRSALIARGEHLTVLCCGEAGVGKTTLMNSLFGKVLTYHPAGRPTLSLVESQAELQFAHTDVCINLTVVDTPGYGDTLDLKESFSRVTEYITGSFRRAMEREARPSRPAVDPDVNAGGGGGVDAVLYFVAPHRLKEVDLEFMRRLVPMASIIPIIAKADTYTRDELRAFREHLVRKLYAENITTIAPPFAVICAENSTAPIENNSTNMAEEVNGASTGRSYPWGRAPANNEDVSDLPALRRFLITDGLMNLHEKRRAYYEQFRQNAVVYGEKPKASAFGWLFNGTKALIAFGVRTACVVTVGSFVLRSDAAECVKNDKIEVEKESSSLPKWWPFSSNKDE